MNVILGISGSIAAYKSLELIRLLKKQGADIKVVLTESARNFVTPLSCQTLSANEVFIDQFILTKSIKHIALSEWGDVLVVGPATAGIIGKAASGIGDDLLSTTILSFQKPILFVPAMDTGMWQNKIVQRNVKKLQESGFHFLEPASGVLASGKIGKGRFPDVSIILRKILTVVRKCRSLDGKKFLVSGGRTEEDIDPVRVLTNRSSGIMAREIMYAVTCRNGRVKGIMGEAAVCLPEGMEIMRARTSEQMLQHLKENIAWCDCLIMAAAVGDYRPTSKNSKKIRDENMSLNLKKNRDLLKGLSKHKGDRFFVGFSLEDTIQLKRGTEKLTSKKLDMIILNTADAIASNEVKAQIMKKRGEVIKIGQVSKWELANKILDECMAEMSTKRRKKNN